MPFYWVPMLVNKRLVSRICGWYTDIKGIITCAIFILARDSSWGYSDFSHDQNNSNSSGAYSAVWACINTREMQHDAQRLWMQFVGECFLEHVWLANLNTPNLSPLADDAITRGGIQSLVTPFCIWGLVGPYRNVSREWNKMTLFRCDLVFEVYTLKLGGCSLIVASVFKAK